MNDSSEVMVSIIVPIFNVAAYLDEGLQSMLEQHFSKHFEVILVDDCSTDGGVETCRRYAAAHEDRVTLVECAQNGGVSVARNIGLERARGRYLMFVDPDDLLPPEALANLFEAAEQYGADITKGNLVLFSEHDRRPAPDSVSSRRMVSGADVLTELYEHSVIRGHVGGKLFRRDKFGALRLPVGVRMAQDLLYFSEMFAAADSLLLIENEVYEYRKHGTGSTGRKYEKGSYIDWLDAVEASGKFARTPRQKRAHKKLLLRSLVQIARECRKIPASSAASVLAVIVRKCREWQLGLLNIVIVDRLGLRSISRYIKLQLALRQIRRNLSRT
jgi:glycosyltransferase involved in cell wall biosynthesis